MNIFKIIKNIFDRIIIDNTFLVTTFILIPLTVFASIYFTNKLEVKGNIAVVGIEKVNLDNKYLNISYLNDEPSLSELVLNKYDAVVKFDDNNFEVITAKSDEYKNSIEKVISGKSVDEAFSGDKRGVGSNIIGYITMFVLMQGISLYSFLYHEKEIGVTKRILIHPINYVQYFLSHFIGSFLMCFVPTSAIVLVAVKVLNLNTVISGAQFTLIIAIMSLVGSAIGLFINSLVKSEDNGDLLGSMLIIITTIISGSFFSTGHKGIFETITSALPQKILLDYAVSIENSKSADIKGLFSIVIFVVVLCIASMIINRNKLIKNN
ncbi:MAG: ABC transporter permease [Clostridiaceae bacterium]